MKESILIQKTNLGCILKTAGDSNIYVIEESGKKSIIKSRYKEHQYYLTFISSSVKEEIVSNKTEALKLIHKFLKKKKIAKKSVLIKLALSDVK